MNMLLDEHPKGHVCKPMTLFFPERKKKVVRKDSVGDGTRGRGGGSLPS